MTPALKIGIVVAGVAVIGALATWQFMLKDSHAKAEGSVARGHALAVEYCSRCHAVERGKQSPVPDAPPFSTFAQRWPLENLEESLAEGIMAGHEKYQMPVFQFDPDQISDLIAYLRTIQEPAPKAPALSAPSSAPPGDHQ